MGQLRWIVWLVWGACAVPVCAQSVRQPVAHGLKGEYFNGPNFEQKVATRIDPSVNFDWNWQYPAPGVQREYFSVRWTGKLYAPVSGEYQFSALVDDGVRVWVGGRKVIDEWRKQDDIQFVGKIRLTAGRYYDLRIEYYNDWKGSIVSVYWQPPQPQKNSALAAHYPSVIPTQYLFSGTVPTKLVAKPVVAKVPAPQPTAPAPVPIVVAGRVPKASSPPVQKASLVPSANVVKPTAETFENLTAGEAIVLRNVFFEQSSYTLLSQSFSELDRLVKTLVKYPSMRIEIGGHTDNVGDARLNQALSENRAKVVANYLVRHGIREPRIDAKGYGGSRPLSSNATEIERARNRRVEFVVR